MTATHRPEPLKDVGEEAERALLERLGVLERLLDRQFSIGGFRFGLDSIVGLIPVAGDTVTTALSAWIIWQAHKAGAPTHVKARMIGHAGFDYLLGLIPLVGDLGDALYKANTRNVRLLRRHLEERQRGRDRR